MADPKHSDTDLALALLTDGFQRLDEGAAAVVDGLSTAELLWRPDADANHLAWLVWHLARQQDEQLAALGDIASAWTAQEWSGRFALPYPKHASGYGMSSGDVGAFRLDDPALLVDYHEAVHDLTLRVLAGLDRDGYERVIDAAWDPPVTVAVRLISVLDDGMKHLGQGEYVRGLIERRRS